MTEHPDLPAEQAYLDRAYACLERMRRLLERAADAGEAEFAQLAIEAWSAKRLQTFLDAERGLLFGRLDLEGSAKPLYVGRRWVHDEHQDVVAINWQAPAARPFYTATPVEPQRVARRRRFRTEKRKLLQLYDEALGGSEGDEPAPLADPLLDELQRSREPHMRDIVATIQADQFGLITRDLEGLLLIQGGPGTGKTAVALHRASWLLYNYRDRLADEGVLVVGPNPTFIDYISHVLPALGEESVAQRPVGGLVDGVEPERADAPDVQRLKGDARMADVLARAIALRLRPPDEDLWARIGGAEIRVPAPTIAELLADARAEAVSYAAGRERFQMKLARRFYEGYGRKLRGAALLAFDDVERQLKRGGFLKKAVDRAWPPLDPERLVREVFTKPALLADAGEGILDEAEQAVLHRGRPKRSAGWSESDISLLDEARALLHGPTPAAGHVVVDEAQDLTPMQLRMVARRARRGSLTVLGDIAQATGPVAYARWEEVLPYLPDDEGVEVAELRLAYRVPREIMDFALPLLPLVAPEVDPPVSYRSGGGAPLIVAVDAEDVARSAVEQAAVLEGREGTVGLIVPEALLEDGRARLERAGMRWQDSVLEELGPSVQLLTPRAAKGLEFDHVVVAEPALVVEERGGVQGLRELYVALTRATKTLVVVHARPLPEPLRTELVAQSH